MEFRSPTVGGWSRTCDRKQNSDKDTIFEHWGFRAINASATVAVGVYVVWRTSDDKNEPKEEFNKRLTTLDKNLRAEMKGTQGVVQPLIRKKTTGDGTKYAPNRTMREKRRGRLLPG